MTERLRLRLLLCCLVSAASLVADGKTEQKQEANKGKSGGDRKKRSIEELQERRRRALSQRLAQVIRRDKHKEQESENNRLIATLSSKSIGEQRIALEEFLPAMRLAAQPGITQAEVADRTMSMLKRKYAMSYIADERRSQIERDPRYLELVERGTKKLKLESKLAVLNMQERERADAAECARYIQRIEQERRDKGERMFEVQLLIYKERADAENAMKLLDGGSSNAALDSKEQKDAAKAFRARIASSLGEVFDDAGKLKPSARFRDWVREDGFLDFEHPCLPDVWAAVSGYRGNELKCVGPVRMDIGNEQYYFVVNILAIKEYCVCESDVELEQLLLDFVGRETAVAKRVPKLIEEIEVRYASA